MIYNAAAEKAKPVRDWPAHNAARVRAFEVFASVYRANRGLLSGLALNDAGENGRKERLRWINEWGPRKVASLNELDPSEIHAALDAISAHYLPRT